MEIQKVVPKMDKNKDKDNKKMSNDPKDPKTTDRPPHALSPIGKQQPDQET
jgi:hypothetical protein